MKKSQKPLISIIMASYNYSQFIEEAINSVLNQTYKNWELLIVDDGSQDNSVEIVKKYSDQYSNIYFYTHKNNENKGLAETVQLALKKSKGKYIAFLESDDYWTNEHLDKKVETFNNYPEAKLVYNDVELFGDKNRLNIMSSHIKRCRLLSEEIKKPEDISKYFIISTIIPTFSCMMLEKNLLKKCNFNPPIPQHLDWWIGAQVTFLAKVYYLNQKLTNWRIHPQSYIGRTQKNTDRNKEKKLLKALLVILKKLNPKKYNYFLSQAITYKLKIYDSQMLSTQKGNLLKSIQNKRIYLYGAGAFAREIINKVDLSDLNILGVIDLDKNKKGSFIGPYEIFHKDEIPGLNADIIVLTVAEPSLIYYDMLSYIMGKNLSINIIPNLFDIHTPQKDYVNTKKLTLETILADLLI